MDYFKKLAKETVIPYRTLILQRSFQQTFEMKICNIEFTRAREREAACYAGIKYIRGLQKICASITNRTDMRLEDNLIDTTSIYGAVDTLPAVTLQIASQTNFEIIWDDLVRRYHYLG